MSNAMLSRDDQTKLRPDTLKNSLLCNIKKTKCSKTLRHTGSHRKLKKVHKNKDKLNVSYFPAQDFKM